MVGCLYSLFCSHYYPCIPWRAQNVYYSSNLFLKSVNREQLSQPQMINRIVCLSHIDPARAQVLVISVLHEKSCDL